MARERPHAIYRCQECGYETPRWLGRCPQCQQWNTLTQAVPAQERRSLPNAKAAEPQRLDQIDRTPAQRLLFPGRELNRVLGGGMVPGSLVLVGGDPGIGKSTLLLQAAAALAQRAGPVLYLCGEESPQQVRLRADRLGLGGEGLELLSETDLDLALVTLAQRSPCLAVIDSIQAVYLEGVPAAPGSVAQMRECTLRLSQLAKERNLPLFLVGHVTKEGTIAGPRAVEHMVDVVLYLEGERASPYRLLRAVKNRFGSTDEIGVFAMQEQGLAEVENPSAAFLAERPSSTVGSAVVALLQGTRPLLVEVQALTSPARLGPPRRVANGFDFNRLLMLLAVLSQRAGLRPSIGSGAGLESWDVLVNVVGGLRIEEPAADLGVALAIASSFRNAPVDPKLVAIGEVGLSGELRGVSQVERRLAEAAALGFRHIILPPSPQIQRHPPGLQITEASTLREALRLGIRRPLPHSEQAEEPEVP